VILLPDLVAVNGTGVLMAYTSSSQAHLIAAFSLRSNAAPYILLQPRLHFSLLVTIVDGKAVALVCRPQIVAADSQTRAYHPHN